MNCTETSLACVVAKSITEEKILYVPLIILLSVQLFFHPIYLLKRNLLHWSRYLNYPYLLTPMVTLLFVSTFRALYRTCQRQIRRRSLQVPDSPTSQMWRPFHASYLNVPEADADHATNPLPYATYGMCVFTNQLIFFVLWYVCEACVLV